jgi:hypothetical protein
VDFSKLPQVAGFASEGEVFDPRAFLLSSVTATEAAALLLLCWPGFTEYRGGVLLSFLFDGPAIDKWFDQMEGDVRAVESMVNHVHLWDVLPPKSPAEHQVLAELAGQVGAAPPPSPACCTRAPGRSSSPCWRTSPSLPSPAIS